MGFALQRIGSWLGGWLARPMHVHGTSAATPPQLLLATLQPADVLLVEGHSRISSAIKYLTQSTWSHAALYVGDALRQRGAGGNRGSVSPAPGAGRAGESCFIEADIVEGVRSVGLDAFAGLHTRICRPVGLSEADRARVLEFAIARLGHRYDLRNVLDLARYLLPTPPVPQRLRRRMLALGSGDPTRAICSTLIAQAFQSVRYPILPQITVHPAGDEDCPDCVAEVLHVRHHSLFAPRDFDVSPYFRVVKPTLEQGFDYRALTWADTPPPRGGSG
ncbi:MAG: lipo-like protein [Betaproteobacteria bacterium]|nr:lipo-like protein [Betaproteobacteria bacterium]